MMKKSLISINLFLMLSGGGGYAATTDSIVIYPNEYISTDYIGNGVQWDPYQLDYGHGRMELSDEDVAKLYRRLDYMKPAFIRVMINVTSQFEDGKFKPEKNINDIAVILDYCQSRNITVMFGDWGGRLVDSNTKTVNERLIENAVDYVSYLVDDKGYDCIKYYNFINEPNGWWSTTEGDFDLWAKGISTFYHKLSNSPIANNVKLVGPDAAIWTTEDCWWVEKTASSLTDKIGLYDIHTYPSKYTINTGEFYSIIKAYRDAAPKDKQIVMGEIGIKYVDPNDFDLNRLNIERAEQQKYASTEDSQMSVYDYSYGIDMADAVTQTALAGYSGSIAWMLDDAMHSREALDKLKIWGFWNIFGDEYFGSEQENVRPWYYAWSLLCRYVPSGCSVLRVEQSGPSKVFAVRQSDNYSIFITNSSNECRTIEIIFPNNLELSDSKVFNYSETNISCIADEKIYPVSENLNINFSGGYSLDVPAQSMIVITNIKP